MMRLAMTRFMEGGSDVPVAIRRSEDVLAGSAGCTLESSISSGEDWAVRSK